MRAWLQANGIPFHEADTYLPEISRHFYSAAWELCTRGILRPGVTEYGAQSTQDGSGGNGYSVTPFGRQWLSETDRDIFVPTESGLFSEMVAPFAPIFGAGFHERANEAIRCYGAHAYLCGFAAGRSSSIRHADLSPWFWTTGWWMMQSAANHSPRSSSLLNRELTGNFGVFGPKMSPGEVEKSRFYKGFSANSLLNGTGNFKPRTGNFFGGTGNFRGGAGTLSKPHFCSRAKFESAKEVGPLGEWTGRRRVNSTAERLPSKSVALANKNARIISSRAASNYRPAVPADPGNQAA